MDDLGTSGGHTCESCGKPATACYRDGQGTGHSEHMCACEEHTELPTGLLTLARMIAPETERP
jgi:hypothetical protein